MKAGWKTSEFWVSLATVIPSLLVAVGVLTPEAANATTQAVAAVAAAVASVGYSVSRGKAKAAPEKAPEK